MVSRNMFLQFVILNVFLWPGSHSSKTPTPTGNLKYLYTKVTPDVQLEAGTQVIERLFPNRSHEFRLEIIKELSPSPYEDAFSVSWDEASGQIVASGTTAVSALFGLNYYLKYHCNIHLAWEGSQLALPKSLPKVTVRGPILDRFRYFQNVCTESYSFAWWDWKKWEEFIDWMALSGINFPLAFTGQELIWERVYLSLGLTVQQVEDYMSGPAFLAWWRMGNLQKWGGPLPRHYALEKLKLQHKVLERTRSLGMLPILPAFAGNVPDSLPKLFPNSTFEQHPSWARFNSTFSNTYMLDPTDPLFIEIGKRFNHELVAEFGTDHVYNCDTFNENQPKSTNGTYLRSVSKATYKSMIAGDARAVWVMQGWLFVDSFWTKDRVKSYLSGVQVGNLIVLDLNAEIIPFYLVFESFYNHSFIWCMLHNFGGLVNLYGSLDRVNQGVIDARKSGSNGTMIGTGSCPEGINQNFVVYDFMTEMSLASAPLDIDKWIRRYSERRYGTANSLTMDAWDILRRGVYNAPSWVQVRNAAVITNRPGVNLHERIWYSMNDTELVARNFIIAAEDPNLINSNLFRHDLVDFSRQFLQHMGGLAYTNMMNAYKLNSTAKFKRLGDSFLSVFDDLELILQTSPNFLLGDWTSSAEKWGTSEDETDLLRFNSLNQITLWGPSGEIIDYATKQWSGLVSNYYKPRWALFISYLNTSLATGIPFNQRAFNSDVLNNVETPFTKSSGIFSRNTAGDSVVECTRVYKKWKNQFFRLANPTFLGLVRPRLMGRS